MDLWIGLDADVETTARRLSSALPPLGIVQGDRVATMAMNSGRHSQCWYGIMGIGAVCHTLNPRLFNADLEYIVNRAADSVVIVDRSLAARLAEVLPGCPSLSPRRRDRRREFGQPTNFTRIRSGTIMMRSSRLIRRRRGGRVSRRHGRGPSLHVRDDQSAQGLGTPIDPILHTLMALQADVHGVSARDVVLPIVRMFHANAWGLPFSAPAVGAKLVMPGANFTRCPGRSDGT